MHSLWKLDHSLRKNRKLDVGQKQVNLAVNMETQGRREERHGLRGEGDRRDESVADAESGWRGRRRYDLMLVTMMLLTMLTGEGKGLAHVYKGSKQRTIPVATWRSGTW